jgi:aromatic ring hydroxylase
MLRNGEEYIKSLRDGRIVYYKSKKVDDVTSHESLSVPINHARHYYELRGDPEIASKLVYLDEELGEISGMFKVPRNQEDLWYRSRIIQEITRMSGGIFNIIQAVGSDSLLALMIVSKKIDSEYGTRYFSRVMDYYNYVAGNDLAISTAQTDVKGNRVKRPHEQVDPDLYVRVVDVKDDGIIVRGAKAHTTQSIASNEIIFLPSRAMTEKDKDYALSFALPANARGLKMIARPLVEVEGFPSREDSPLASKHTEIETLTILDDVFVPWQRVFMFREWKYAGDLVNMFSLFHRFTALSYRVIQSDLYLGAARMASKVNGIKEVPHIREELIDIVIYREILYMALRAASLDSIFDKGTGIAMPNPIYTNIGKLYANSHFHDVIKDVIDITGGITSTLPSSADLENEEERGYILKYFKGAEEFSGEERFKVLRFIRELVGGPLTGYTLGLMIHAEGSEAASKISLYREYDFSRAEDLVSRLIGLNNKK